jgi:V8-like Glu-specific endopeptidase
MSRFTTVLLSAVAAAAVATPASAAPKHNPKSPHETSAYWTPERMKNAKPRERARPGGGGGGGGTADWSSSAVPLSGTSYGGANLQNGKVFMTFGGGNYVCSGTAVTSSAGVNLVWTAGHCVTDGASQSQFASNFMFVPGYYRGAEPQGRWTFTQLDSTPGWEAQGANRFTYDVGAARVQKVGAPTATFAGTIGTRPISFGVNPTGQRLVAIGYPASGKFNGSQQHACASPFRRWDGTALLAPMQISCDMTGGSSGGGLFLDANNNSVADAGETLVSNTSYGYQSLKNALFGPFLASGGQAQALYNSMD